MWVCGVCLVGVGLWCEISGCGFMFWNKVFLSGRLCSFKVTMEIIMSKFSLHNQQNSHAVVLGLSIEKSSRQQFWGPQGEQSCVDKVG